MKLTFLPVGGRGGYGFNYFCAECETYVGCSDDERLVHPETYTERVWFSKTKIPIECSQIGVRCEVPNHEIEAREIV